MPLLDRWEEAEGARRAALALRRELGDDLSVGANLRNLSTTLWRLCRGQESGQAVREAVQVLEELPPGKELAWAYANSAAFGMNMGRHDEAIIALLGKAQAIGEELGYRDVVSYALNAAGLGLVDSGGDGIAPDRAGARDRAGGGHAGGGRPRVQQPRGRLHDAEPVRGLRPLLRRGHCLLPGP